MPEQLVAAANPQHNRASGSGRVQRVTLELNEILRAQTLVAILTAAEVEEVMRVGIQRLAEATAR